MSAGDSLLRVTGLTKRFPAVRGESGRSSTPELCVFQDVCFEAAAGEVIAIVGESGSGKSSLLHLLAALERPSAGEIWFGGRQITALSIPAAAEFRNLEAGYVWQFHYLLPEFSALENVAMPLLARGVARREALAQAALWLQEVGLQGRGEHRSGELSGGEQQRVAIARALITAPRLLLADEPTGDLDDATAERIFLLLQRLTRERRLATIIATHNRSFAERCDALLRLSSGSLQPLEVKLGLSLSERPGERR